LKEGCVSNRSIVVGLVMTLMAGLATDAVLACGDKFLVPSRGMRFELTSATRQQASILVYARTTSSLADIFERLAIERSLRNAGYRPTVVANAGEFIRTLREASWDVVMIDVADGPVRDPSPGAPAVLGVAAHEKAIDLARARPQYAAILKSPSRSQAFVEAFDSALTTRNAARRNAQRQTH
jgi:hypothetical protein